MCPAGNIMKIKAKNTVKGDYKGTLYQGFEKSCTSCILRSNCIRKESTKARQVYKMKYTPENGKESYTEIMKKRFDSPEGRSIYSKRMGTVEPVFGHLRGTLHLDRFTMRSKKKVNNQWLLYCIVHNMGKIQRYAEA